MLFLYPATDSERDLVAPVLVSRLPTSATKITRPRRLSNTQMNYVFESMVPRDGKRVLLGCSSEIGAVGVLSNEPRVSLTHW
jgi:hypothetical protein